MRMLVSEDEKKVASFIRQGLEEEGYVVEVSRDGLDTLERVLESPPYDLIVLDIMLPKRDGFTVLKTLRARRVTAPVLIVTARGDLHDRVFGLDLGADDYLQKPFSFDEFLARVRALLRRGANAPPALRFADLTLDLATREACRAGRWIALTGREYALLECFMRNANRILSRAMIARSVWGLDLDSDTNVVDVYVGYLRRKIDGKGEVPLLHTVRGTGYALSTELTE